MKSLREYFDLAMTVCVEDQTLSESELETVETSCETVEETFDSSDQTLEIIKKLSGLGEI